MHAGPAWFYHRCAHIFGLKIPGGILQLDVSMLDGLLRCHCCLVDPSDKKKTGKNGAGKDKLS